MLLMCTMCYMVYCFSVTTLIIHLLLFADIRYYSLIVIGKITKQIIIVEFIALQVIAYTINVHINARSEKKIEM